MGDVGCWGMLGNIKLGRIELKEDSQLSSFKVAIVGNWDVYMCTCGGCWEISNWIEYETDFQLYSGKLGCVQFHIFGTLDGMHQTFPL